MRILIAPHEICGQMQLLAETFRCRGHMATAVSYEQSSYLEWVNDINMGFNDHQTRLLRVIRQGLFTAWTVPTYDIFHFFFGKSLLPMGLDLPWLKRLGKKVVVHFRGSDIRPKSFFEYQKKHFLGDTTLAYPLQSPQQRHMLNRWQRYADFMLVSTPDLLRIVPEAKLIQQAIDLSQWEYELEPPDGSPQEIRVAHAPTARNKKGTELIIKAVETLKSRGYPVTLVLIEGVPHGEVKQLYRMCHIGIDRLLDGWYGNVSIELMAMGKPVLCYIEPELATHHRPDIPIVSATPLDLADKLEMLLLDQGLRRRLGEQGRAYVEKWHDANKIAEQLIELYQS